jgi:ligand-binding sensor domain-containing protein
MTALRLFATAWCFVACWTIAFAQGPLQLSDWQTFSSMRSVSDATSDAQGRLWCATSGGVFVHDPATSQTTEYRNVNALSALDATAITYDPASKQVIVGGFDGALDIADEDGSWRNIRDIRRATQYQRRRINDLLVHDGTLYIAADFGIVTYDMVRNVFLETIDRIGPLQEKTPVSSICIAEDSLWATTDSGVVVAPLRVSTLRLPSVWRRVAAAEGLPLTGARIVRANGNTVLVAAGDSLLRRTGMGFERMLRTPSTILNVTISNGTVYASSQEGVHTTSGSLPIQWPNALLGHYTYLRNGDTLETIGFVRDVGIARSNGSGFPTVVTVNSPSITQFMDIEIDGDGRLWAASYNDQSRSGQGANMYDGTSWTTFNDRTHPQLGTNSIYRVSVLRDGRVIFGTWGRGGFELDATGTITRELKKTTTRLNGIEVDENYVLVGDAELDRKGTLWMVNEQASDRMIVSVDDANVSQSYRHCLDPRNNYFRVMAIDASGTKWVGGPGGNGLVAYSERSTPDDPSDDLCVAIRSSTTNLPDNIISALTVDKNGALWIGTARGVAVISAPGAVTNTSVPFVRRISAIAALQVNDIHVDALNYKWVATSTGVYVLNEDGTEVLNVIQSATSPLLSDNVRSVAVDDQTGRAWFGMAEGLSSVATQSKAPLSTFSVSCYPQPYRPSDGNQLVIDGLASDADIRILTPGGVTVQAIQTRGRQALWDGTDAQGRVVPPGVYIVQVRSASSKESGVAKIVVTR